MGAHRRRRPTGPAGFLPACRADPRMRRDNRGQAYRGVAAPWRAIGRPGRYLRRDTLRTPNLLRYFQVGKQILFRVKLHIAVVRGGIEVVGEANLAPRT